MVGQASWRVVTCAGLLLASGAITIAASAQRWWPACKLGAFDHGDCLVLRDDAFDVVSHPGPWTPVGATIELYGVGLVLLAVALLPTLRTPVGPPEPRTPVGRTVPVPGESA